MFIFSEHIYRELERTAFPPAIWNQQQAAFEGLARTTNAVEGWHFGVQAFFSGSHPSLWKSLETLRKDAATQKYLYLQSTAGISFSQRKNTETWKTK